MKNTASILIATALSFTAFSFVGCLGRASQEGGAAADEPVGVLSAEPATDPETKEQARLRERAVRDSLNLIRWEKAAREDSVTFFSCPEIPPQEASRIGAVIEEWLEFYGIDISGARLAERKETCLRCPQDTMSLYYIDFSCEDDSDSIVGVFYSPDRRRYVSLGIDIFLEEADGEYYFYGWDDCQQIYLTDRQLRRHDLVLWFGASTFADTVFWPDNDTFIITGKDRGPATPRYFISVFDTAVEVFTRYEILSDPDQHGQHSYMEEVTLGKFGITMI